MASAIHGPVRPRRDNQHSLRPVAIRLTEGTVLRSIV